MDMNAFERSYLSICKDSNVTPVERVLLMFAKHGKEETIKRAIYLDKVIEMKAIVGFVDVNDILLYCSKYRIYMTMLMHAVRKKNLAIASLLLQNGSLVNADIEHEKDDLRGRSALHWAILKKDLDMVNLLIMNKADVNKIDHVGNSPLMMAADTGNCDIVRALIYNGANVHVHDSNGDTALIKAATRDFHQVVSILIDAGSNVNAINDDNETALMVAGGQMGGCKSAKILVEKGAYIDAVDKYGQTALIKAVRFYDNLETATALIEMGANVDIVDNFGRTALICIATAAVEIHGSYRSYWFWNSDQIRVMKMLICKSANLDIECQDGGFHNGFTPLLFAAQNDNYDLVTLLIDKGANLDVHAQTFQHYVSHMTKKDDVLKFISERNA